MRIAYLINQYPMVSHSFIRREILALERQGIEIERISLRAWDVPLVDPDDLAERERTRYVLKGGAVSLLPAVGIMLLTRPVCLIRGLRLAWQMSRRAERHLLIHIAYLAEACKIALWLRKSGVQHVHAHFGTNSAEIAMLLRVLGGPPWSFTVHGPEEFEMVSLKLHEKVARCSFVVAISYFGRSQLFRVTPRMDWKKVHVVHCGLDRPFLDEPKSISSQRRLVCVARLSKNKGQLLLLEAARLLASEGLIFELVLAGDGDGRPEIERLLHEYGLRNYVRVTGWISSAEVKNEILAARALVLPSLSEGIPVVIMEAMALHRPVISTYVGGIPELVCHGEHGWLVPAGDVKSLADAVRACLVTPAETLTRMGLAAHSRVRGRHDIEVQAAQLAQLFKAAMSSKSTYPDAYHN